MAIAGPKLVSTFGACVYILAQSLTAGRKAAAAAAVVSHRNESIGQRVGDEVDAAALRRHSRSQLSGHRLDARLDLPLSRRFRLAGIPRRPVQLASDSHGRLAYRPLRPRFVAFDFIHSSSGPQKKKITYLFKNIPRSIP